MVKMKEKNKANEDCPVCHGSGKLKDIKTVAHFGPWHIGKETYNNPCFFCNIENFDSSLDNAKIKRTSH